MSTESGPTFRSGSFVQSLTPGFARVCLYSLLLLLGCGKQSGRERAFENLLLVTFDTTRADRLGCLGGAQAHTPNLDRLAQKGVLFENCIAAAPITLPSHATILTGLQPYHHGARNNGTHVVPAAVTTLAEQLSAAGFATGAVISAVVLDSRFGLDQGFDHYDDDLSSAKSVAEFVYRQVDAHDSVERAMRWLSQRGDEPWFLWLHLFDPHADYAPPEAYLELCQGSAYDGEIAYADAELGRLLASIAARGESENTLVVMTADHGESLGEHGEATHSLFIYDATTRVPLIFSHPSFVQGKRVPEVVGSADIVPTLLELCDLAPAQSLDGQSLAAVLMGKQSSPSESLAYSEAMAPLFNHGWSDLRAARGDRARYIRAPREEFYDLGQDPGERDNLLPGEQERAEPLRAHLRDTLPDHEADSRAGGTGELDHDLRASLDALGYVSSDTGGSLADATQRPDPKDKIAAWERTLVGWGFIRAGMHERALPVFREVIAKDPSSVSARQGLATALRDLERYEEALQELDALVLLPTPGSRSFVLLAEVRLKLTRDDWLVALAKAKELDPLDPMPWAREGDGKALASDWTAARQAYEAALERDERYAAAWLGLANIEHKQGHASQALDYLQRAIAADPISHDAQFSLGVQYENMQRLEEALAAYARASALKPASPEALICIGNIHLRSNQLAAAQKAYTEALRRAPASFHANYNLGQIEHQLGNYSAAAKLFSNALASDPKHSEAWRKRMMACRSAQDPQATAESAEALLQLLPDDVQALMTSAVALSALGQEAEAHHRVTRALELDRPRVETRSKQDPELAAILQRMRQD